MILQTASKKKLDAVILQTASKEKLDAVILQTASKEELDAVDSTDHTQGGAWCCDTTELKTDVCHANTYVRHRSVLLE